MWNETKIKQNTNLPRMIMMFYSNALAVGYVGKYDWSVFIIVCATLWHPIFFFNQIFIQGLCTSCITSSVKFEYSCPSVLRTNNKLGKPCMLSHFVIPIINKLMHASILRTEHFKQTSRNAKDVVIIIKRMVRCGTVLIVCPLWQFVPRTEQHNDTSPFYK